MAYREGGVEDICDNFVFMTELNRIGKQIISKQSQKC